MESWWTIRDHRFPGKDSPNAKSILPSTSREVGLRRRNREVPTARTTIKKNKDEKDTEYAIELALWATFRSAKVEKIKKKE